MLLVIGGACPGAASAATVTGQSGRKCKTISNPAVTTVTCLDFGLRAGRLSGCAADEACVSSSAVSNPSKYAPPWQPTRGTPEFSDTNRAWRSLISAVEEQPGLQIVERNDNDYYVRAQAPSKIPEDGTDDVEFLLRPDSAGPRALYRSSTRQSVYVYPLQQPVPNQQSHTERLDAIRLRLGWERLGLAGDSELEAKYFQQQNVRNVFGLMLRGVEVPTYEDDY